MRAMVLEAPGRPLIERTSPVPQPGPGQVLVRIADQALYTAKNAGRDQVSVPPEPDPSVMLEDPAR